MPYATRNMIKYMKEKGLSNTGESGTSTDTSNDIVSSAEEKKIRDLPSSVDPADDEESPKASSKTSVGSKSSSKKKKKSNKKSKSKKSKSKSKPRTKDRKKSLAKPSSSGKSLKKKSSKSSSKRKFKMVANTEMALALQEKGVNYDEMTFDEKKVLFMQTLLKANIGKLKNMSPTEPSEEGEKSFSMYSIDENKPLTTGKPHSAKALYTCTHASFPPDYEVVCKVYDPKLFNPKSSLFLKVLRHLGKEHPNIIQTWDVISKDDSVCVFQEIGPYGNLADYFKKKGTMGEKDCQLVACQLRAGMDFLGDMGISHRAISPRHLLLVHKDMRVKLTGFRSAIIYYNELKDEINFQPCLSVKKKGKESDDYFNAPESYGNSKKELFDPVAADVFSAGATVFHLLTGDFPYDCTENNPEVEHEILKNIRSVPKLSHDGKSALSKMLTTVASKRYSVEQLKSHPWFEQ